MSIDISIAAFPLSLAFVFLLYKFTFDEMIQKKDIKHLGMLRRFLQYEPFVFITAFVLQRSGENGKPYFFDLSMIIFWILLTIASSLMLYLINPKRVFTLLPEWNGLEAYGKKPKYRGIKFIAYEIADWIDAAMQAIFTIILLNIFFFQLYEIPTESMVPTFLVKDRVLVFKTLSGPKFPLSKVGLPHVQDYKRGDIVVFRNPHYKNDHKNEVKSFLSQFLYMCTLTLVNTNTDENGKIKADPLVKRITGLPGEQLMMMDGVLYSRTKDSPDFKAVTADSKWAAWGLSSYKQLYDIKNNSLNVEYLPVAGIFNHEVITNEKSPAAYLSIKEAVNLESEKEAETLLVESERRNLDLESARLECISLAKQFSDFASVTAKTNSPLPDLKSISVRYILSDAENLSDTLLYSENGAQWFNTFMNSWHKNLGDCSKYKNDGSITGPSLAGGNLYDDACLRLDVMLKLCVGRIIVRNAELRSKNISRTLWASDSVKSSTITSMLTVRDYILRMNQRNMPIFPANGKNGEANYIDEDSYFMMGDNRYNSMDMRHSYTAKFVPLSPIDECSFIYECNIDCQSVSKSSLLGKASLRFWPLGRAGFPK
ncbi:MAG: signal peptidase I [Treponema sp.]|nr:signal peptidase I [Treponema sp.]